MKQKLVRLLLFFIVLPFLSAAQTEGYKFYYQLDSIKTSGFYDVLLTPEIKSHVKTDYSDLRIVNDSGKWVPHILRNPDKAIINDFVWQEMKIQELKNSTTATDLIIKNDQDTITSFKLQFKTTTVERYCTLTGSDDLKSWFIINDSILIQPDQIDKSGSEFEIAFPPCNYKYYKLVINNKGKAPFNITTVCTPRINRIKDKYFIHPPFENPGCIVEQKDSNKLSYIKVSQKALYHFEQIDLSVSGAKYFSRKVDMYIPDSSNNSFADPGNLVASFFISNNSSLKYLFKKNYNSPVFYLIIYNEDNLPLKVDKVKTFTNYLVATTYLEKGMSYGLYTGNDSAIKPDYDLVFNKDSTSLLNTGNIIAIKLQEVKQAVIKNNNWWIWPCIIAIIAALGLLTYKLSGEMEKSDN
jgi:hypothetical protein